MALAAALRARRARKDGPVAGERDTALGMVGVLTSGSVGWSLFVLARLHGTQRQWTVLAVLVVLAVALAEIVQRAGRLARPLRGGSAGHQLVVWSLAAAVVLTPGQAVLLNVLLHGYVWLRFARTGGEQAQRVVWTACTAVLACLAANALVHGAAPAWAAAPPRVAALLAALVGMVGYGCMLLGAPALLLLASGGRAPRAVPSGEAILRELASLWLGGLVAYTAAYDPWLCVLVLGPLLALHHGTADRELENAAMFDAKTGLLNARAWEHRARRELLRARRGTYPVSVLLVDIDRFKAVNDRFGHLAGDAVLRTVAGALSDGLRTSDAVGRFGGEEFVVVLPMAGIDEALRIADRLRARIADTRVPIAGCADGTVTASIGVACAPVHGDNLADLLRAADSALYRAKDAGRNRVMAAEGRDEPHSGRVTAGRHRGAAARG